MCARFGSKPVQRRSSVADMVVNIDQARGNVEIGYVHNLSGLVCGYVFIDGSDFALDDSYISHLVDVIGRIDHMAALYEQIVTGWGLRKNDERKCDGDRKHRND